MIVTPGQDTALTIRNALAGGKRAGIATALGVAAGQVTWAVLTAAGIVALLLAFEPGFRALRYAGAAYLIFLGGLALRDAFRRRPAAGSDPKTRAALRPRRAFRQGLLSNLSNPKMVIFFPSLLPQFVSAEHPSALLLFLLGLVFAAMTLTWLSAYTVVVVKIGDYLRRANIKRAMDAMLGAVLIGLGVRVALTRA